MAPRTASRSVSVTLLSAAIIKNIVSASGSTRLSAPDFFRSQAAPRGSASRTPTTRRGSAASTLKQRVAKAHDGLGLELHRAPRCYPSGPEKRLVERSAMARFRLERVRCSVHAALLGRRGVLAERPMRNAGRLGLLLGLCLLVLWGLARSPGESSGAVSSIFVVPGELSELSEETFFDHPWPSDLRRDDRRERRFRGLSESARAADSRRVRRGDERRARRIFPGGAGLPPLHGAARPLVAARDAARRARRAVEPRAPRHRPELARIRTAKARHLAVSPGPGVYVPSNTLAFMPALGYPLRRSTRYALVVTNSVRAEERRARRARPRSRSRALARPRERAARSGTQRAVRRRLGARTGRHRARRNRSPRRVHDERSRRSTEALRDAVRASYPAPSVDPATLRLAESGDELDVYEGTYGPSPDFQRGTLPFAQYGYGGELSFDADGVPVVEREFELRFALAVPKAAACPEPETGYPIVLYAHGTGGDYRTMLVAGGEAESLGARCIATMGIDQIFHGDASRRGRWLAGHSLLQRHESRRRPRQRRAIGDRRRAAGAALHAKPASPSRRASPDAPHPSPSTGRSSHSWATRRAASTARCSSPSTTRRAEAC